MENLKHAKCVLKDTILAKIVVDSTHTYANCCIYLVTVDTGLLLLRFLPCSCVWKQENSLLREIDIAFFASQHTNFTFHIKHTNYTL